LNGIMVLAGTKDARDIAAALAGLGADVLATVTTGFGRELLEAGGGVRVNEGRLDAEEMKRLIEENGILCVVDASHPFAREASVNAIRACEETGVEYLRFERQNTVIEAGSVILVKSFEAAAEKANEIQGNILLTIGSNHIGVFAGRVENYKERLYARVLPDSRMVERCERAGLTAGNIIAMKGPFSEELNMEIIKYCRAAVLVTKESGDAGGTKEKIGAASRLGIPVILVERPEMAYGRTAGTVREVEAFVKARLSQGG
jgi:precorrin-6x reductase